jgi:hypothetical protein
LKYNVVFPEIIRCIGTLGADNTYMNFSMGMREVAEFMEIAAGRNNVTEAAVVSK